jgi:signal transduction histidine kinase
MLKQKSKQVDLKHTDIDKLESFRNLSYRILNHANRDIPRVDFLKDISKMLVDFSKCGQVEMLIRVSGRKKKYELIKRTKNDFHFEIISLIFGNYNRNRIVSDDNFDLILEDVVKGKFDPSIPHFTKKGSYWKNNAENSFILGSISKKGKSIIKTELNKDYNSFAMIPLIFSQEVIGVLKLNCLKKDYFHKDEIELYEDFTQTLGFASVNQFSQAALRERVKELTCLYGIAQAVEDPEVPRKAILQRIVELLPPAWQYPKITCARIILDELAYQTPDFKDGPYKQTSDINVKGEKRGKVEVIYKKSRPSIDEGPFLKEERKLINAIAKELALIIERRESEEDKKKLKEQLLHADRLATIGQLAAGVAHELNEPLGTILGFAQLAKKNPGLPTQSNDDIEKIITTSLFAREIIKKLMLFTRQTPPKKIRVNLNQIITDGLYFLESRCSKEGIEIQKSLTPSLPAIYADPSQLNQVLVNLVVNAVHAMSGGGYLTIKTYSSNDVVTLSVKDNGIGISQDTLKKIFMPFFTSKDVGEGTGLGLAVVHGIVIAHGGTIEVDSEIGRGTRFDIRFPVYGYNLIDKGKDPE